MKYKIEYCEKLIKHMSTGKSFESFAGTVNSGVRTIYEWAEKYKEFKEAKQIGYSKALEKIESIMMAKINGKGVDGFDSRLSDPKLIQFMLKTRFHKIYGDRLKQEISNPDGSMKNIVNLVIPENGREAKD